MKNRNSFAVRYGILLVVVLLLAGLIAGCGGGDSSSSSSSTGGSSSSGDTGTSEATSDAGSDSGSAEEDGRERMAVTIMAPSFAPEPVDNSSPALQALEELTNMDITLNYVANANYEDRFNVTLASADLPHIMVAYKTPSFINAARDGAFWDITDYLADYEYLSQANEIVLNNSSIDGRIYGVYRSRPLGRNAATINTQWLENLGLEMPKTMDDLYDVLYAFTYDDPNRSGQKDTYGMVVSEWEGPWNTMQVWMGAPNKWGEDENGDLKPDFMFEEYREALRFFKRLYDDGLVNTDFAVMDSGRWFDPIVNGEAGFVVDVADQANRLQNRINDAYPEMGEVLDIIGALEGPKGLRNLPTPGFHGVLAISTTAVKSEKELRRVLQFLDDLNRPEAQDLAYNGVEGIHHEIIDGELVLTSQQDGGELFDREVRDLNQFQMAIPTENFRKVKQSRLQQKSDQVIAENNAIVVGNPAEPLVSQTYSERGVQLDNIINDARIQFIVGQIDEEGFDAAIEQWMNSGGREYIEEINELYREAQAAR